MPNPFSMPIRTLQRLPGTGFSPELEGELSPGMQANDALTLNSLRGQRADEARDNLFNAVRTGDRHSALALKGLIGDLESQQASSPLGRDTAFMHEQEAANAAARQAGFDSSAQAGDYARSQAERKVGMPLEVQQLEGQQAMQRQQAAQGHQLELQKQRSDQTRELYQMLTGGGANPNQIRSVNPSSGAIGFQTRARPTAASRGPRVPPALSNALTKARQAYAAAPESGGVLASIGLGGADRKAQAKAALDQQIASVLQAHPANNGLKTLAHEISMSELASAPFEQILAEVGGDGMTPDEIDDLRDLLGVYTGRPY